MNGVRVAGPLTLGLLASAWPTLFGRNLWRVLGALCGTAGGAVAADIANRLRDRHRLT